MRFGPLAYDLKRQLSSGLDSLRARRYAYFLHAFSKVLFHPDPISTRLRLHDAGCEINHDSAQSLTYLGATGFCCEPCFSSGSWASLVSPNAKALGCGWSLQTASLAALPLMTLLQGSAWPPSRVIKEISAAESPRRPCR